MALSHDEALLLSVLAGFPDRVARRRIGNQVTLSTGVSAEVAGLRYVNDRQTPGIRRIGRNKRFRYVDANGRTVSDPQVLARIRSLE